MRIALTYNERRGATEADAEFDTRDAIESIARFARQLGHHVTPVDVTGSIPRLIARLRRMAPDLVWNLAEGERGTFREAFYPALFEQLELPHTGSSASALAVCLDKTLAKRVVAGARTRVPRGVLVRSIGDPVDLALPVIVKPNFEGSSKGITAASVVTERARLREVIGATLACYPAGALVEQFVPGIDVAVGWIAGLGLLPPIWYRHDAGIYDYALKHDVPDGVRVELPALATDIRRRLDAATLRAFEALGIEGYGRADFRITPEGDVVFLEMNPLPSFTLATGHDEMYVAAAALGRTPRDVIGAVLAEGDAVRRRTRDVDRLALVI